VSKLYAWFNQGGRLEVWLPADGDGEKYRNELIDSRAPDGQPQMRWVELADGSFANLMQVVRLEVEEG
jgi:hypothetical protein